MADLVEIERQINARLQEVAPDIEDGCDDVRGGMIDHLGDWSYDMSIIDALQDGEIWKGLGDTERRELVERIVDRYYPEAS